MSQRRSRFWYTAPIVFSAWLLMLGWMVVRQRAEAGEVLTRSAILRYQPNQEVQWFLVTQDDTPVGYTTLRIGEEDLGGATTYTIDETRSLTATVSGIAIDTRIQMHAVVDEAFAIHSFSATAELNDQTYDVEGTRSGATLTVTLSTNGEEPTTRTVELGEAALLPVTLEPYLASRELRTGQLYTLQTLDPFTLGTQNVRLTVTGREQITVLDEALDAIVVNVDLQNVPSTLYLNPAGERVREVAGGYVEERVSSDRILDLRKAGTL